MAGFATVQAFLALTGEDAPTPAERKLIEACRAGKSCILGDRTRPEEPTPERRVRASLLRLLITGGTAGCGLADAGVFLVGGWIDGELDLKFTTARGGTVLVSSTLPERPTLLGARLQVLNLQGSELRVGIFAQGLRVEHSVVLRDGFTATGTVDLMGAKIGGQLNCSSGRFDGNGGRAIDAQNAEIGASVFLSGADFSAKGTVDLNAARIGGQLDCSKGTFDGNGGRAITAQNAEIGRSVFLSEEGFAAKGTVDLVGAKIGSRLDFSEGTFDGGEAWAINASGMRVEGALVLHDLKVTNGRIHLALSHAGVLVDGGGALPASEQLFLDGFTYDRLVGPTDAATRLDWLKEASVLDGEFFPQPYLHLAKVLRAQGHDRAAREILVRMEERVAKEQKREDRRRAKALWRGARGDVGTHWLKRQGYRIWDWLFRLSTGYGYKPGRALTGLAGLLVVGTILNFLTFAQGGMAPASPVILASADWQAAMAVDPVRPSLVWLAADTPLSAARPGDRPATTAAHYETFSAAAYTADVLIPFLDIRQEAAWAPSTATGLGTIAWLFHWALKSLGWFLTAMGLTGATGLVRRTRE